MIILSGFFSLSFIISPLSGNDAGLKKIKLPAGFQINIYADNVKGARSLTMGAKGTVFVGSRSEGKVYALINNHNQTKATKVITIAEGLHSPNGVSFYKGALYVAEISRILRFDRIEERLNQPLTPIVVNDSFPRNEHHGWKFIAFGPDQKLYIPVGAPCNVCIQKESRYASIMRMDPDGTRLEIFASGIRNTVGFDWHPVTKELWFTDNGRDWMGDDLPPDELNNAPVKGLHFGFPYCHGNNIPDPQYGDLQSCKEYIQPALELNPHAAALGMRFYTGKMFPREYLNQVFIAEHGSWNRTIPLGYRIILVRFQENQPIKHEIFAEGWLQGLTVSGRPVDILVSVDGALLVSDDYAGKVYRIYYEQQP